MLAKLLFAAVFVLGVQTCVFAQQKTHSSSTESTKTRNVIWIIPSRTDKINGVAIGPFQSNLFFEKQQRVNGLTIGFVGTGILVPFMPHEPYAEFFSNTLNDSLAYLLMDSAFKINRRSETIHNGLVLSMAGSVTDVINGASLSFGFSATGNMNGLSLNPLMNFNYSIRGFTAGLYNSAGRVRGVQIGLWN